MKCVPQWPALFSSTEAAAWFGTVIAFLAMPLTKHAKTSEVLLFLDPKTISSTNLNQCELQLLPKGRQGQLWVSAWLPLFSRNLECRALELPSPDILYLIKWILGGGGGLTYKNSLKNYSSTKILQKTNKLGSYTETSTKFRLPQNTPEDNYLLAMTFGCSTHHTLINTQYMIRENIGFSQTIQCWSLWFSLS